MLASQQASTSVGASITACRPESITCNILRVPAGRGGAEHDQQDGVGAAGADQRAQRRHRYPATMSPAGSGALASGPSRSALPCRFRHTITMMSRPGCYRAERFPAAISAGPRNRIGAPGRLFIGSVLGMSMVVWRSTRSVSRDQFGAQILFPHVPRHAAAHMFESIVQVHEPRQVSRRR